MKKILLLLLLFSSIVSPAVAQKGPLDEIGFNPGKLYDFSSVDSVNLFNGNLSLSVPLGVRYAVSSTLSYQFVLTYNSKVWDYETIPATLMVPNLRSNAGLGWRLSFGRLMGPNDSTKYGVGNAYVYEGPAGDDHSFFKVGGNAENDVAQVSGQLRLIKISSTVRDVEFPSGEVHRFEFEHSLWRLKQMRDRFTGHVDISYSYVTSSSPRETAWTVTDSAGRSHSVQLSYWPTMADGWSRGAMISSVTLQGYGGATATYTPGYTPFPLGGTSCNNYYTNLPALTSMALPDGTQYSFEYPSTNCSVLGPVGKVTVPTGGTISYEWGGYTLMGDGASDWKNGVCATASSDSAVVSRTIADGATTRRWDYVQQLGPTIPTTYNYFDPCQTGMDNPPAPPGPIYWSRTSVLAPGDADNHRVRTDHYFSVFSGNGAGAITTPLPGIGIEFYGYGGTIGVSPLSAAAQAPAANVGGPSSEPPDIDASDGTGLLSTQIYQGCTVTGDCTNGTLLRTTFDGFNALIPNPQLVYSRTRYDDDAGCSGSCFTQWSISDNNGLDQFRTKVSSSNFTGAAPVTTTTQYPAWSSADLIDTARAWTLDTYSDTTRAENGVVAREQFCFDIGTGTQNTGTLLRHRVVGGDTPLANDILTVFDHDAAGNVQYIRSYGGDQSPRSNESQALGTGVVCSAALPTYPAYKTKQTFTNGLLATSQYYNPLTDQPLSFKSVDRTIDSSTGVVTSVRDTTGLATTTLSYSAKPARLESTTLPTGATTTYTYTNATGTAGVSGFTPAKVHSETPSSSAGTLKEEVVFDGMGRPFRQSHLGPQGNWLATETKFDEMGRTESVSQPESTGTNPPSGPLTAAHKTTYRYDGLGQTVLTTAPDNTTTSVAYQGSRIRDKTARIATGDADSAVTTREEYDQNGRLIKVTEDKNGAALGTNYTYDVGNRLTSVSTTSGGTQSRQFHYDLRGFLLWEQHPELGASGNGKTVYGSSETSGSCDARGHAHRKVTGSFDLTTVYDAAERVTSVAETNSRTLKLFEYDTCGDASCKGKLDAAARFNYAPDLGTIAVTETYQYTGAGGLPSRRDRAIGTSSTFDGLSFFFGQNYNDLGAVSSVIYPCRSDSNANCAGTDRTPPTIAMGYTVGALTSVGSYASNITYQPNGVIGTVTHGSGSTAVSEIWDADSNGIPRPSTIRARNASSTELWNSGSYAFDGSANIKSIGGTSYYYDTFDRLTGWKTGAANNGYDWSGRRYDAFGNYLSAFQKICMPQVSGQTQRCFTSNFGAQQVTGTTNHYAGVTYDDMGNVTAQSGRTFTWDSLGVMTGATANGRTFRYLYSPDDERIAVVERVVGSGNVTRNRTTWSARDFDNRLLTTWTDDSTSGTRTITWKEDEVWRGGALLANLSSSGTKHYVLDHLGSPRLIINASGQSVGTQNFAPFGSGGSSGSGTIQFAGMERDLTAVGGSYPDLPDYDHQRYYDIDWGRFISLDPVIDGAMLESPQSWNRYAYSLNNPLKFTDPTGLKPCKITLIGDDARIAGVPNGTEVDSQCVEAEAPKVEPVPEPPKPQQAGFLPLDLGNMWDRVQHSAENLMYLTPDDFSFKHAPKVDFGQCIEDNSFSNVYTFAGHTANAVLNVAVGTTGRVGVGGVLPHATSWQHKALSGFGGEASRFGRLAGRGALVLTVAEGFYDIGTIGRCGALAASR